MSKNEDNALLVEYQAANDLLMHYDSFAWQVGASFVAGVFIFWGLIFQSVNAARQFWVLGEWFVVLVMTGWWMYAVHGRLIYRWKLHRLWQLEKKLNLEQHRRFARRRYEPAIQAEFDYDIPGPSGHHINRYLYSTVVSLSIVIGIISLFHYKSGWGLPFCAYLILAVLPICMVIYALVWASKVQRQQDNEIKSFLSNEAQRSDAHQPKKG